MKRILILALLGALAAAPAAFAAEVAYTNDFENLPAGKPPKDVLILNGQFTVRSEAGNQYLEVAPTPLNSFGLLIGPDGQPLHSIRARIRGDVTGRRTPEFAVGLGGVGGYFLWVMPAVDELQIRSGDDIVARVPFQWKAREWTWLRLEVRPAGDDRWVARGKAWAHGRDEPGDWMIRLELENEPAGRPSIWGVPYSEKPIGFDDIAVGR
jgi:hypothetical protein